MSVGRDAYFSLVCRSPIERSTKVRPTDHTGRLIHFIGKPRIMSHLATKKKLLKIKESSRGRINLFRE